MVFWHKGGNKLKFCGMEMQIVPKLEKIPRGGRNWSLPQISVCKPENSLVRQEFILEGSVPDPSLTSSCLHWQGQLRFSQLVVGRGGYPSSPCGSGCQWAPLPSFKVTKTKVTIAVEPIQSTVCAFGRQCWVHFLWASWEIWIHADKGKGDEQHSLCWESVCAEAVRAHLVSEGS